jgi:large subunit ribosomal protein L29
MKAKDIRDMSQAELEQRLKKLKEELFNLRFQHATGQLDNPKRIPAVKKDIARIKTVQRLRELKVVSS